jgi:hypothetical protein
LLTHEGAKHSRNGILENSVPKKVRSELLLHGDCGKYRHHGPGHCGFDEAIAPTFDLNTVLVPSAKADSGDL